MSPNSRSTFVPRTWKDGEPAMTKHPLLGLVAACAVSLLAHGVAYGSLGWAPKPTSVPALSRVSLHVHAKESAPPSPPPPPAHAEPAATEPRRMPPKTRPASAVNTPPPPPTAPPRAPLDLRGVTLTNDHGGASWSSAVGDGTALTGPVGAIGAAPAVAVTASSAPAVAAASSVAVVDVADLSSRPVPPELGGNLREHYPAAAKARGIGGSATVRARIEPDGRVRRVELVTESSEGFGDACRRTLQGSLWSAPRDREGRAVATYVRYTCRFVVGP